MLSVAQNAFRLLGLHAGASQKEIHEAAGRVRRALKLGVQPSSPFYQEWLGPAPQAETDVRDSLSRLINPAQRIHERLFWFFRVDESLLTVESLAKMQEAVEEAAREEHPAARHDAALLSLTVLQHLDPEAENLAAWERTFTLWREVVERREFWSLLVASDLKGDFEQLCTPNEVRELRQRTMRLVTTSVAELGKDSVAQNRNGSCRRALEVIRCGALPERLVYEYEQDILGPAEDSFDKLREEVFAPYISVFLDASKGPQIWKRFEEEIKPRLRLFLEVAGPRSLATRRIFESVASSLNDLGNTYWRMSRVDWIYRKAWALAPPGSATLLQIEKTLREIGAEAYIKPRTEEEYFQNLTRELRAAPPSPDLFVHYISKGRTSTARKRLSTVLQVAGLLAVSIFVAVFFRTAPSVSPRLPPNFELYDRTYRGNLNYNFNVSKMVPSVVTKSVPRVNWRDLRRKIKSGRLTIVDVRSPEEYDAGHIPGALTMPEDRVAEMRHLLRSNRPIVTYGANSDEEAGASVAWQLGLYGHRNVSTLKGGFDAWVKNGQTIELAQERGIKAPVMIPPARETAPQPPPISTRRR